MSVFKYLTVYKLKYGEQNDNAIDIQFSLNINKVFYIILGIVYYMKKKCSK